MTRVFDAPREFVWKAWTEHERMMRWWGPKGSTMLEGKMDLRPGGMFHYRMRYLHGQDMWGKFVYREVVAPERLVFINAFSDAEGGLARHPLRPTWPLAMVSTLTRSEHEDKTTLAMQWVPISPTESERKTFKAGHESMQKGWTGTLDQLAEYLGGSR